MMESREGEKESPEQQLELFPSFTQTLNEMLNTDVNSEPQEEPEPESNQETPEPASGLLQLKLMESRIQKLYSRQVVLQKMQHLKKTAGCKSDTTMTGEESGEVCELEKVQEELQELQLKKEQLEMQMQNFTLTADGGQQDECPTIYKTETPYGGIYTLPPSQLTQGNTTVKQSVKTTPEAETSPTPPPLVPVESLGSMSDFTRCPSCNEVVCTVTHTTHSDITCLLCCLWASIGCVAGCCLIPFFQKNLRNIHHHCPRCQAHIHTYRPL
ncbi:uncharacterized protein [Paralichthys olivaceus]|uniref:uncharacterized protein n=1 Tax=Paralichthys olivaceus TaxID=8255 RepID=UPI003752520B